MGEISITQIIFVGAAGLLVALLPLLWLQMRAVRRVMGSMRGLLLEPTRVRIEDARKLIEDALDGAAEKIQKQFESQASVLAQHISRAEMLEKKLGVQNKLLVSTADSAADRIATMARGLENLVGNLSGIVGRPEWKDVQSAAENFNGTVTDLLKELESKAGTISKLSSDLSAGVGAWTDRSRTLSDELSEGIADNTEKINLMAISTKGLNDELSSLQHAVVRDFENVKLSSHGIEGILANNDKLLAHQLENMDSFTVQAKKLLTNQVNTMSDTANRIGTEIRLAESSLESGASGLNQATETLFGMSKNIKDTFDAVAREIMDVRAKFQAEVGEFSNTVVAGLREAQSSASHAMADSRQVAEVFGESLAPMLSRVNETVAAVETVGERAKPLAALADRLHAVVPLLSEKSDGMMQTMSGLSDAADRALKGVGEATLRLEKLSGESRQQMIGLMNDYAKAAETMRELNGNMARAGAPAPTPAAHAPAAPARDIMKQLDFIMEKLHDLSVDLTRSIGAEIPDSVMEKYNGGDRAIFSKWFAKMISNADKKRVRNMFKTDAVFRSQATQFVHGFAKMLSGAERAENRELVVATLMKTDLGTMYQSLKACL